MCNLGVNVQLNVQLNVLSPFVKPALALHAYFDVHERKTWMQRKIMTQRSKISSNQVCTVSVTRNGSTVQAPVIPV